MGGMCIGKYSKRKRDNCPWLEGQGLGILGPIILTRRVTGRLGGEGESLSSASSIIGQCLFGGGGLRRSGDVEGMRGRPARLLL